MLAVESRLCRRLFFLNSRERLTQFERLRFRASFGTLERLQRRFLLCAKSLNLALHLLLLRLARLVERTLLLSNGVSHLLQLCLRSFGFRGSGVEGSRHFVRRVRLLVRAFRFKFRLHLGECRARVRGVFHRYFGFALGVVELSRSFIFIEQRRKLLLQSR